MRHSRFFFVMTGAIMILLNSWRILPAQDEPPPSTDSAELDESKIRFTGNVSDAESRADDENENRPVPIKGVRVSLFGDDGLIDACTTKADGRFELRVMKGASFQANFRHTRYEDQELGLRSEEENIRLQIQLMPSEPEKSVATMYQLTTTFLHDYRLSFPTTLQAETIEDNLAALAYFKEQSAPILMPKIEALLEINKLFQRHVVAVDTAKTSEILSAELQKVYQQWYNFDTENIESGYPKMARKFPSLRTNILGTLQFKRYKLKPDPKLLISAQKYFEESVGSNYQFAKAFSNLGSVTSHKFELETKRQKPDAKKIAELLANTNLNLQKANVYALAAPSEVRGVILNNYADFLITEGKWLAEHAEPLEATDRFDQAGRCIAEAKRLEVVVPVIYVTEAKKKLEMLGLSPEKVKEWDEARKQEELNDIMVLVRQAVDSGYRFDQNNIDELLENRQYYKNLALLNIQYHRSLVEATDVKWK